MNPLKWTSAQWESHLRKSLGIFSAIEAYASHTRFGQVCGAVGVVISYVLSHWDHTEEPKSQAPPSPSEPKPGSPPQ